MNWHIPEVYVTSLRLYYQF